MPRHSAGLFFQNGCDKMVKKLFLIFINVIIISLFAALPVSADSFDSANFRGVNFNWHSGAAEPPPSVSGFSHYLIIYSSAGTWYTGDREYAQYFILNDNIDNIRLTLSDGGVTYIGTNPVSVTPYSAYRRYISYDYSPTDGYVLHSDSTDSVGTISLDFNSRISKRVCVFSDLPCYDQNGNEVGGHSPLQDFSMSYFMDGSGVYHYVVGIPSTIAGNNSFSVDWFVFDGSYTFPVNVESDTLVKHTLTETYCNTYLRKFTQFYSLWEKTVLGYTGLDNVINPATDYYIVPDKRISYNTQILDNSFSPSNIGSIYRYVNGDVLTTHNTISEYDFNAQTFLKTRGGSDFSSSSDISICVVIHDNTNNKYILLVHKFNINDCLSAIKSINNANDESRVDSPSPSTVNDFQSLADYLKNLNNNLVINYSINNDNLVRNLTSYPWASVVNGGVGGALAEFPWANLINGGVGGALDDFLPNLSSEFDTVFSGLFNDFTVPSQDQLDDIEDEIQAEQDELHDKLAFVEDVKTEVYFVSSSIAAAGSSEPHFKQKFAYYVPAYNEQSGTYYLSLQQTPDDVTFFRGAWIDVNTREALKDLITVFASLAVLLHIWHTLPSTVGNMPVSRGGD